MYTKTINIKNEHDFEILRTYEKYKPLGENGEYSTMNITINILDDINFKRIIKPLMLDSYNIIINGNNKKISGLKIDNINNNSGLFGAVNMILVKNLNIDASIVRGYRNTGLLVGFCTNDAIFKNVSVLRSMIISKGHSGSLVGLSRNVSVDNCIMEAFITGVDCVGGFVGTCLNYNENNSLKNPTLMVMGNNHSESVGYAKTKNINKDDDNSLKRRYF